MKIITYTDVKTILDWAQENLSPTEMTQFNAAYQANTNLFNTYQSQNLIEYEKVTSQTYLPSLNQTIDVVVGEKTILAPGVTVDQIPMHPDYIQYYNRWSADVQLQVEIQE